MVRMPRRISSRLGCDDELNCDQILLTVCRSSTGSVSSDCGNAILCQLCCVAERHASDTHRLELDDCALVGHALVSYTQLPRWWLRRRTLARIMLLLAVGLRRLWLWLFVEIGFDVPVDGIEFRAHVVLALKSIEHYL